MATKYQHQIRSLRESIINDIKNVMKSNNVNEVSGISTEEDSYGVFVFSNYGGNEYAHYEVTKVEIDDTGELVIHARPEYDNREYTFDVWDFGMQDVDMLDDLLYAVTEILTNNN